MFEKMLRWLRSLLDRMFDENSAVSDIAISDKMSSAIDLWTRMYEDGGPWCGKDLHSLRLPVAIASEFSRLVTLEMEVSVTGSGRATFLQNELNSFFDKLRNYVETGCALGGVVFKPYVSDNGLSIDVVQGDCFYPTTFDSSGRMTGAIFTEQIIRKKVIYTRAEHHEYANGVHKIENRAFKSNSSATLGSPIDLTEVPEWAQIAPEASIENVDRPLFAYFRIPLANRVDRHSPLGVSVYAEAVDTIHDADEQYGRFLWEFEGGELAVDVDEDLFKHSEQEGVKLPKRQERLYRRRSSYHGAGSEKNFYEVFSPTLRDTSLKNGLNTILQKIEYQCGLAYGTISDPQVVEKTAEEIRSSKQRSYATVKDIQKALENSLDDLIYAMDKLSTLYKLAPQGSYKVAYDWDDSIINDPTQRKQMFWQYVTAGKFPFWRYLVEFEGYSENDAKAIEAETQSSLTDPFGFGEGDSSVNA
ncbi:phage portal protein [Caproiciproducens faecalis]|uniref:Phage portal protein n=1 Tax=Caproiciproducens faecalis TaxID=2820301 RepID=A0ABS7DRI1_9FIRM|nr:phage portal protein [Caproiciproducens faecalis]MBW7573907.1 phage portal protein [Caproiciproducens faecalis]